MAKAKDDKARQQQGEQSRRFIETARELGCDESEERFKEALRKIAKAKRPKSDERQPRQSRKDRG